MASKITMPKLSDTMEQGIILKVLKQEGDRVEIGDVLAEVETDKANMELELFEEGVIRKIFVKDGDGVPIGGVVAILADDEDEDVAGLVAEVQSGVAAPPAGGGEATPLPGSSAAAAESAGASSASEAPAERPAPSAPSAGSAPDMKPGTPPAGASGVSAGRIFASPVARKLAAERGIDLSTLRGSGPSGRIVKADVLAARPASASAARPAAAGPEFTVAPASTMRDIIGRRMVESKFTAPHFYVTMDCDMAKAAAFRAAMKDAGRKFSFNDLVIKAVANALAAVPAMNGTFEDGEIRNYRDAHVGFAVAFEGGLITPVVREANRKSLGEIAAETADLIARAKVKKLKPDEYTGGTFTVSNMGMLGVEEFTAIINRPQIAIVAVGGIRDEPVVSGGQVVPGKRMKMTVSTDHRAADGADAARFLGEARARLEDPALLIW